VILNKVPFDEIISIPYVPPLDRLSIKDELENVMFLLDINSSIPYPFD
jgi:hypothetical protein